ncbi:hypothetical protein GCM10010232_52690 [Streptomyces amakusaensis]|uniref:Secreted protein n=1 Tax=Streptomyces amakusaensis TaxID=67271 RepID=A0ABW0ANW5_9ACTN
MNRFHTAAVTAATAALILTPLSTATATPAEAAATPGPKAKFLAAKELPTARTPWTAEKVKPGRAEDFCVGTILPKSSSRHRAFHTEMDTSARQTITVAASEARAKALVTKVRKALDGCLAELRKEYPGLKGKGEYEGKISVEEGAHVYSIDTADPRTGADDVALYSVGRDGGTVTVVSWGQLGDLKKSQLKGFQKTARTSVAKLY